MYRGGASVKMRWKLGLAVLILLAVIVGGFCYINANLRPVLRGLAGARVEAVAAKAMNAVATATRKTATAMAAAAAPTTTSTTGSNF